MLEKPFKPDLNFKNNFLRLFNSLSLIKQKLSLYVLVQTNYRILPASKEYTKGKWLALKVMYYVALGEVGAYENFGAGEGTNATWEKLFGVMATFMITIHMMNMLVAMMAQT